jgi:hypothetical protein
MRGWMRGRTRGERKADLKGHLMAHLMGQPRVKLRVWMKGLMKGRRKVHWMERSKAMPKVKQMDCRTAIPMAPKTAIQKGRTTVSTKGGTMVLMRGNPKVWTTEGQRELPKVRMRGRRMERRKVKKTGMMKGRAWLPRA